MLYVFANIIILLLLPFFYLFKWLDSALDMKGIQ